ncbi:MULTISPECIES: DUF692 domain-containing protein [unclassified Moraxella]|uniref:HvfB family MNIO-type RiPP peptide maturase n=1 Tax=unclassified Moraxella TaxID=2685852 RepID=UPI00359D9578
MNGYPKGAGLGFRRELCTQMKAENLSDIDFFEVSPENWLNSSGRMGGQYHKLLKSYTEQFAFICHGLSLSIGSSAELDIHLLKNIKRFMQEHGMQLYTEHLAWTSDNKGHLYDLLPIPCTNDAVMWTANRIKQAQDIMGMQIGFENASYYYAPPDSDMSDSEFITAVVKEADCLLHLDINNIYVNSQNFGFDPIQYLHELPLDKVCYMHVAGHYVEEDGFIIDTHGNAVIEPVWRLLDEAYHEIYRRTGKKAVDIPTCLERDFNFPELDVLRQEVNLIHTAQRKAEQSYTLIA